MAGFGTAVAAVGVGYVLVVGALYVMQRQILFVPDSRRVVPSDSEVPEARIVRTETADGLSLEGWWVAPAPGRPVILYLHGNGGSIASRDGKARDLVDRGYGLLLAGYRGYGGNPGAPSETGLIEDGRAWLRTLRGQGLEDREIVLYGESLGSGVAVALATEATVGAVVLEAPYTSIADIAASRYWFAPVRSLIRDPFDSLGRIAGLRAPVLVVHGTADRVIPVAHGERLFEAAPEPKRLVRLQGGGHTDLFDLGALGVLDAFLDEHGVSAGAGLEIPSVKPYFTN